MKVTLIGQSTLLIEISGFSLMTDPWWGQFEFMRGIPLSLNPETIQSLDLMLVSHNHIDHWCRPAIDLARKLGTTIIGSTRAARRARRRGLPHALAMVPGDVHIHGDIKVHAVPAFHPFAKDAVGFVVEGEKVFYFSGDTRYSPELVEALAGFDLDVAFVQVACSRYPLVGKDGMDLGSASRLLGEIKPKLALPIHYQVKGKILTPEELHAWSPPCEKVVLEPGVPFSP